ncbi:hypothetical protein THRCLA_02626 [Thraustotheca clavata]|uniref:Nuclear speckle splicing regulatory protein 1 N-terminal domain-containing protein n=1 Tax=Thraustotheca clavata TaxID=74557 RepID=A0A1W0A4N0_9STRA|nr:hypothetical protein THRCLA_02626 [Thraustotheca clavata]
MAFSMKLKPGKKPMKASTNALGGPSALFSVEDQAPKLTSKKNLPPPPVPMQAVVAKSKAERAVQEALASDPNAFDYDDVYDSIQAQRTKQKEAKKINNAPQSKYIGVLMEKAKVREIEHDRIRERRLLKEREEDDKLHGDKEKFITSSYKRKLMEAKRWEEEDARLAKLEEAQDVTKRGQLGMAGFYANLLTNNIAMGGNMEKATSAYTTGKIAESASKRQKVDENVPKEVKAIEELPSANTAEPVAPEDTTAAAKEEEIKLVQQPVKSREDLIREAKERYLARKKQQESQ